GLNFVVVSNEDNFEEQMRRMNIKYYIKGSPFKDDNLRKAHISKCRTVIATTSNDNDNFAIVVSARILLDRYKNTTGRIISIARNMENKEKLLKIGADHVVTPQVIAGQRLASFAIKPAKFHFMDDIIYSEETDIDMEELELKDGCPLIGKPLKDTNLKDLGLTAIAIKRDDEIITLLKGDMVLKKGDIIIIIGRRKNLKTYEKRYSNCF
ncbi:MAG: TrkA family potassium uptake protein, partial [Nitrospirae bacterium]